MITMPSRVLVAGLLASAMVAATTYQLPFIPLATLVRESDLIVVADVTTVSLGVGGRLIATATPVEQWKGHPDSVVRFMASSALTADTFAMPGERAVLFLGVAPTGELVVSNCGRGRMPVRVGNSLQLATCRGDIVFPNNALRPVDDDAAGPYSSGIELHELKRLVDEAREQLRRSRPSGGGK